MNTRPRKLLAALLLSIGAGTIPVAVAQSTAAPTRPSTNAQADEKVTLDTFVVTGTLIPIAAGSPAIPVTVLGAPEIERTGISTDLIDVLRKSQPSFYGSNNLGSDVANINSGDTNGGSGVSLRNRSTLVLINGRRAAISPVLASGGNPRPSAPKEARCRHSRISSR